jgi:tRNA pseudouridine32 synthase/23S rRNA pseudouridine746 synthase
MPSTLFHPFKANISDISLPEKFTFPFYYEPHPLSILAAVELQQYLATQTGFQHNFGLSAAQEGLAIGKMFGVLVVQNHKGELGHLWAFSGKLAEQNQLPHFVPTVFDMLSQDSFFKKEEININRYNSEIEKLMQLPAYLASIDDLQKTLQQAEKEIIKQKLKIKAGKKIRADKRKLSNNETELEALNKESQEEGILLKKMTQYWRYKIDAAEQELEVHSSKINQLKEKRRQKSAALQQQLFKEYAFLNQHKELKSLGEIFNESPPAGAGECAAPKLLHFAFQHNLKPIAMAEFWWGASPKSEVRKHAQFYPACTGKCEPILKHMLQDIRTDANPFEINPAEGKEIEIIFEDAYLAVINKPAEFLSVPGKQVTDSVYNRMKTKYPDATGPLVVHRLDMSTSGLLIVAKTAEIHKKLQSQFIKRKVQKRYVALLEGIINDNNGLIDLPLRVDLDNRPNQLVCYDFGKSAQTKWEVIARGNNRTLIHFYPITGRTHQLRVHAAHPLGLNTPILGDDLYGNKANRLYLHAESLTFQHPVSKENITITVEADFQ